MMKMFISFFLIIFFGMLSNVFALEKGAWSFVKTDEYCYIGSQAIKTDLPNDKIRGDYYILVYKNIGNSQTVVQIEAGYDYKNGSEIIVNIDNGKYEFYSTEDMPEAAWTDNDDKVIFAMKKGLKLVVTGKSSRGTITNDEYTLKGFTASYNKLLEDC